METVAFYDNTFLWAYRAFHKTPVHEFEKRNKLKKEYEEARVLRNHYAKLVHDLEKKD